MRNGIETNNTSNRCSIQQHEKDAHLKNQGIITASPLSPSPTPASPSFLSPKNNIILPLPSPSMTSNGIIHRRSSSDVGDSSRANVETGKPTRPKNGDKNHPNILVGNNITHNHAICIERSLSSQSLAGADWPALTFPANCCMSANESVLLTKSGEILVSRCRNAVLHQVVVGGSSELAMQSMISFDGDCAIEEENTVMEPLHYASSPSNDRSRVIPDPCCHTAAHFAVATVEAFSNFGSWEQRNDSDGDGGGGRAQSRPTPFESVPEGGVMIQTNEEEGAIEMEKQSSQLSKHHGRRKKRELSLSPTASYSSISATESASREISMNLSDTNRGFSESKGDHAEYLMDLIEEDEGIPDIAQSQSFDSQNPGDILVDMQQRDIPLPSFDYSCYSSVTEVNRIQRTYSTSEMEVLVHGIPRFLKTLSQVRITKISANPLGGHVLLISKDGILFSYGRNDHGQLGNGRKSCIFQMTPTIITPLLENGGKAIECAAGVTHSLVVVKTDGLRVGRLCESSNSSLSLPEKVVRVFSAPSGDVNNRMCVHPSSSGTMEHHQIYSFGQNDFMKLGLLKPSLDVEDEVLPRRVAMHCKVWVEDESSSDFGINPLPREPDSSPRLGIFKIVASLHHSAALVRRSSNAIEAYTWGKADDGALGHCTHHNKPFIHVPTQVETLSYGDESRISGSLSSSAHGGHLNASVYRTLSDISDASHSEPEIPDYPVDIALGPSSTIVLTTRGRCFSFGKSDDGMLGIGDNISKAFAPTQISFSENLLKDQPIITSLSVGARHVACVTKTGRIFSWGVMDNGRLGIGSLESQVSSVNIPPPSYVMPNTRMPRTEQILQSAIAWQPLLIPHSDLVANDLDQELLRNHHIPHRNEINYKSSSNNDETPTDDSNLCVKVCAGTDSTLFLMRSGAVLSCGKESGRLGQSSISSDVFSPKPVFGGLKLWQRQEMLLTKESR